MAKNLHFIFGDQLSLLLLKLHNFDKKHDVILMCEVMEEATYAWHHPKKIALIFSAMRHFALELEGQGYVVDYVKLDDEKNSQSFDGELQRAIKRHNPQKIIAVEPSEYRVLQNVLQWSEKYKIATEIIADERFLCSKIEFRKWAKNKKELRLEFFYREMRKKYKILVDAELKPLKGKWNFDIGKS